MKGHPPTCCVRSGELLSLAHSTSPNHDGKAQFLVPNGTPNVFFSLLSLRTFSHHITPLTHTPLI